MHLRLALVLLAAAVAVTKTEALQFDQPPALGVKDADNPGQKDLKTGDSVREERQFQAIEVYNALKTSAFTEDLKATFVARKVKVPNFVNGWADVNTAFKRFSDQKKALILDFLTVLAQNNRAAMNDFMKERDAIMIISIAERFASTNNKASQDIADKLRSCLKGCWSTQKLPADYVFNLLKIDKSVSKAQEKTTMVDKVACLFDDPAFVMWTAYVHRIHEHDTTEMMSRILVPAHFGIEEWKKILATAKTTVGSSTRHGIGRESKTRKHLTSHRELDLGAKEPRGAKRKGQHEEHTGAAPWKRLPVKYQGRYVENAVPGAL
uniref:RxLR effector candidate protein n=1 Tax=Hyaloperonospora arabidopsidis (strain Emoy2) TaxID=559515 RepID=M4BA61_HYAAE|nr:RxLR effector candidate protein [Hyaloperonospora arabidopsidis Emoy2]